MSWLVLPASIILLIRNLSLCQQSLGTVILSPHADILVIDVCFLFSFSQSLHSLAVFRHITSRSPHEHSTSNFAVLFSYHQSFSSQNVYFHYPSLKKSAILSTRQHLVSERLFSTLISLQIFLSPHQIFPQIFLSLLSRSFLKSFSLS